MTCTKSCGLGGKDASVRDRGDWKGWEEGKISSPLLVCKTEPSSCPRPGGELCHAGEGQIRAKGPSGGKAGEQVGELQSPPCQLCHTLCHLFSCRAGWVAKGGCLDSEHSGPQCLPQCCTCSPNLCSERCGSCQPAQGVPNKHQAVSSHHHPLAVGHEETWGLVGPSAGRQGLHSRLQC